MISEISVWSPSSQLKLKVFRVLHTTLVLDSQSQVREIRAIRIARCARQAQAGRQAGGGGLHVARLVAWARGEVNGIVALAGE